MTESHFSSAQEVKDKFGRQYHLNIAPGDVNKYILLCGDPQRAHKVAKYFDEISFQQEHREYVTISGSYKNCPLSVIATGIGCDNTEIAIVELSQCIENPVLLRIGTCGSLQPDIELGDIVVSTAALRYENTSRWFAPDEFPAVADHNLLSIIEQQAVKHKIPHHLGFTATCSGFYGAQERTSGIFKPYKAGHLERLAKLGVLNFEMEASTIFVLASIAKIRAGAICTVFANRPNDVFINPDQAELAENRLIELGLNIMINAQQSNNF